MTAIIEDASIRHVDRLYEIEMECFEKAAFTKRQIAQLLTDYNSVGLVAKENHKVVGFVIAMIYVDRNKLSGHILTIDVSLAHRRKGIGQMLLQEVEKILKAKGVKTCHLEVREDNVAAISLYRKFSYQKIGKLKNYYGKADGIYLKKALT